MAKRNGLSGAAPRNAFAEGAARFAEIARTVKAQQVAEQQETTAPARPMAADAPDEVWARKFMSQGIGPAGSDPATARAPVWHAPAMVPDFSAFWQARVRQREFSPKRDLGLPPRPGMDRVSLGGRLGKDEPPRRSWLARLFRGA